MNDAEAMDRLAHRFKSALGEEVNGGDLVELVGDLLQATGRSQDYTLATVANMRKFAEENPAPAENVERPRCIALSLIDGVEVSGDAGDYFTIKDEDEPLTWEGEPMILVRRSRGRVDALTGEVI
jgi:hypothetical protein